MADMDPIMEIARRHNLFVVEDCAHAPGAEYKGRKAGSIGDIGCFSFHSLKNMSTLGEGGMSSVWLAVRADGTHRREVALKLPHRHLLDRGLAARMLRERDILAAPQ
jgi:hypothetical protein